MRNLGLFAKRLAAPSPIAIPSFRRLMNQTTGIATRKSGAAQLSLTAAQRGVGHDCAQCISILCCLGNNRRSSRMRARKLAVFGRDVAAEPAANLRPVRLHAAVVAGC